MNRPSMADKKGFLKVIRNAKESDSSRIAEIHIFGWRNAYRDIIDEKYLYNKMSVFNRVNQFIDSKEFEDPNLFVFEEDEIIKGFMKIGECRNDDKKDSFELWGLYIEPLMQRKGIGTKLTDYCERIALEHGYSENVLWVLKENHSARKFYETQGYVPDGKEEYMENIKTVELRYVKQLK